MKITINRKELLTKLTTVRKACPSRPRMPILGNVLMFCAGPRLTLLATNLDYELTAVVEAVDAVTEPGMITIEPKLLIEILRVSTDEEVMLEATDVSAAMQGIPLSVMAAKDYPRMKNVHALDGVLEIPDIKNVLSRALWAMATEDSRPALNSVYLNVTDGKASMVTANGYAMAVLSVSDECTLAASVLIPAETVALLTKVAGKKDAVTITTAAEYAILTVGEYTITTPLVLGTFPNFRQLIPDEGTVLEFNADQALRQLKVLAATEPSCGIIRLEATDGVLRLSAKAADAEDDTVMSLSIPADGECKIAIDIKYLKAAIIACNMPTYHKTIRLTTTNPRSPMKFTTGDGEDVFVVMPMFVQWPDDVSKGDSQ